MPDTPAPLVGLSEQEAIHALHHAHEWLERVDARASGYFGLDHKRGENEDGCTICHAVAVLEGRKEPLSEGDY